MSFRRLSHRYEGLLTLFSHCDDLPHILARCPKSSELALFRVPLMSRQNLWSKQEIIEYSLSIISSAICEKWSGFLLAAVKLILKFSLENHEIKSSCLPLVTWELWCRSCFWSHVMFINYSINRHQQEWSSKKDSSVSGPCRQNNNKRASNELCSIS